MERCNAITGRRLRLTCAFLAWLIIAPLAHAGQWLVEDVAGVPGETVDVPIFFVADGETSIASAQLFLDLELGRRSDGPLPHDGDGLCVFVGAGRVRMLLGNAARDAGTRIPVCSVPVVVPRYFRMRVSMQIAAYECVRADAQPTDCEGSRAWFLIDGVPRWYERAAVVVPLPTPRGPTRQSLLDFDYAEDPATPPLRSFDAPRPARVDTIFTDGDWTYPKSFGVPNAAVAALLRAVRPTYASTDDLAAGVAAARNDPQVEAVIPNAGQFPFLVYPARPVAGQPFALWFATDACRFFVPESFDDRIVRVEGSVVQVLVPELANLCGVPPGGENHTLLNMPGLPAGAYTLQFGGYVEDPDALGELSQPLQFEVVLPGAEVAEPVRIPATGGAWLLLLGVGMVLLTWRMRMR